MAALPDATALDNAVIAYLQTDPILASLIPDGVFYMQAPPGASRFGLVWQSEHSDELVFGASDANARTVYGIKAVGRTTAGVPGGVIQDAAARMHDLLHLQPVPLGDLGYELMICKRVRRIRDTETDPANRAIEWQHVGGYYELQVCSGTVPAI